MTWNFAWYGGHHVPSYSLTFPPLAALIGPRAVGVLGALLGALAGARIAARELQGEQARAAALLFALTLTCGVWIGRMPFTLAIGLAAAAIAWPRAAVALSALATATSPMAGLLLCVVAAGVWWARRDGAAAAALVVPAVAVAGTLAVAFPDDGAEWFRAGTFWPALALALLAAAALPRGVARNGAVGGIALLAGAFAFETPVGQNAVRYGTLLAPPALAAAAIAAAGRRRAALAALTVAWTYLALLPAVRAVVEAHGDPSTDAAFHAELAEWLDANARPGDRVEVPMTANHWEAGHLALRRNIARGWLRQIDRARNPLFYDGDLTGGRYLTWLREERVAWVAVPRRGVPLDRAGAAEAALAPRVLRRAATLRGWTVYAHPVAPLAGDGTIEAAGPAGLRVRARGTVELAYRLRGQQQRARLRADREKVFRIGDPPR